MIERDMPDRALHSAAAVVILVIAACGPQAPAAEPEPENAKEPVPVSAPIGLMNASVVLGSCPDGPRMDSRSANVAIQKLVEPCSKVPGGAAHFSATLLPGGRIELASPSGDKAAGMVPTCVLQNQLRHRVLLSRPCEFDVALEERAMSAPVDPQAPAPR